MSFIDLMTNVDWSEGDIVNRTETMLRSEFSVTAERILTRKAIGVSFGVSLSAKDLQEAERFMQAAFVAQAAGEAARADMALLRQAWAVEAALRTLADVSATDDDKAAAQSVVDAADAETLALVEMRKPVPVEDLESVNA